MENLNLGKIGLLVVLIAFGLGGPSVTKASMINITINPTTGLPAGDIDKGLLGNNDPSTNFSFLLTDVGLYNNYLALGSHNLPTPIFTGFGDFDNLATVSLTGFAYAVVHYGKGTDGLGQGGGIVFYYLNNMTGNFTFPEDGLGPNGNGGISSVRLFGAGPSRVPDGGATLMFLGSAFAGLGAMRRFLKG